MEENGHAVNPQQIGTPSALPFKTMDGWIDVHAQFNGGEPQRLKVRCLGVMLRGFKDELTEFNQESTPETQGWWNTFGINVQRSTRGEYHSLGLN
uniref:Uncharacterized protein n=1 Tax=Medicago truncatula TaxID=3880 RepID=A2Q2H5_MEDTR|nr:hypothetical protein MtrDRAFT_AC150800g22v2 [Medicago truncatula]